MKPSEAILKGYRTNGGKQCVGEFRKPDGSMCVSGAYNKAMRGSATAYSGGDMKWHEFYRAFREEYGIDPVSLNNNWPEWTRTGQEPEPFPWQDIVGMAQAIGY